MPTKIGLRSQILILAVLILASLVPAESPVPGFSGLTTESCAGLTTQQSCYEATSIHETCNEMEGIYRCNCRCTFIYSDSVHGGVLTPQEGGDFFHDCIDMCKEWCTPPSGSVLAD